MTQSTLQRFIPVEKYRFPAVLATVFLFLTTAYFLMSSSPNASDEVTVLPVSTMRVERTNHYYSTFHFTGLAQARQVSKLGFDRVGLIDKVSFDVGDVVKAGTVMARLDIDRATAAFESAKVQLASADERLAFAETRAGRVADTHKAGYSSNQQLDQARGDLAAARADASGARGRYLSAKVDLDKSEIRAPFDGVVTHRYLDGGATASAGVPVFRFVERGMMEIHVGVTTEVSDKLKVGDSLLFERANAPELKVRLSRKGQNVNLESRTVTLIFDLDDPRIVRDGELMDLSLNLTREGEGFWVPLRAMSADVRGLWRVYTVKPSDDGTYEKITFENVQLLTVEGNNAYVSGSLHDGDMIVSDGLDRLAPGQRVRSLVAKN